MHRGRGPRAHGWQASQLLNIATFNFDGHCNGKLTRKVEGGNVQTKEWGHQTDTHQTEMSHKCMPNSSPLSVTNLSTVAAGGRPTPTRRKHRGKSRG